MSDPRPEAAEAEASGDKPAASDDEPARHHAGRSTTSVPFWTRGRIALAIYVAVTIACFVMIAPDRLRTHTPANHFALLADAWLHGRLDLGGPPPAYTGNNDFAVYDGKHFISFPPFPAVLLVPFVKIAGGAERVKDSQVFLWFAGVAPSFVFLALERLRDLRRSRRTQLENAALAILFALGTVYWFSAIQGTVWFAAHVIGAALASIYLFASIDASHPILAGVCLGLGFATRTPLGFAFPFFLCEAWRVASAAKSEQGSAPSKEETPASSSKEEASASSSKEEASAASSTGEASVSSSKEEASAAPSKESPRAPSKESPRAPSKESPRAPSMEARVVAFVRTSALFAAPAIVVLAILLWHNHARFGDAFEFGHRYLTVVWRARIEKWGLFSYHYFPRNLAVVLTSLPFTRAPDAPFQINAHGLALWFTTPIYAWALWPRRATTTFRALAITALAVALPSLCYQNSGWVQFGYRFSNDFAPFLFAMIAVGARRFTVPFWLLAAWSLVVNAFGAATFDRSSSARFYFFDGSQKILHQPD